uniref:RING-type domain-containing protein n=1 Tax=Elaeophora elaphi TaxID=1147741 RepID=A0A0R3RLH0_9BILA
MRQTNDRMGEVLVLGSMAKSASEFRTFYTGKCECQAIQLNKKCLEAAEAIGCRHAMMTCHLRLQDLYNQLNDEDSEELARQAVISLTQEMELFCNFCGQRYGLHDNSLQALRCSHIFHEKCLQTYLAECLNPNCPKCQCKAVLMDSVSVSTPSVSSFIASSRLPVTFSEEIPTQCTDQTMEPFDTTESSMNKEQASGQRYLSVSMSPSTFRELKTVKIDNASSQAYAIAVPQSIGSLSMDTQSNLQKRKSLQPQSKPPVFKVDGTLPVSSVLNYSEEELRAGGPLVLPRGLTVTDV